MPKFNVYFLYRFRESITKILVTTNHRFRTLKNHLTKILVFHFFRVLNFHFTKILVFHFTKNYVRVYRLPRTQVPNPRMHRQVHGTVWILSRTRKGAAGQEQRLDHWPRTLSLGSRRSTNLIFVHSQQPISQNYWLRKLSPIRPRLHENFRAVRPYFYARERGNAFTGNCGQRKSVWASTGYALCVDSWW